MSESAGPPTTVVFVDPDGFEVVVGCLDDCRADLGLVDALARLQLAARRRGQCLRLRDPTPEIRGLLDLVGLTCALGVEPCGEAEVREELVADEVVEPGDAPV